MQMRLIKKYILHIEDLFVLNICQPQPQYVANRRRDHDTKSGTQFIIGHNAEISGSAAAALRVCIWLQ